MDQEDLFAEFLFNKTKVKALSNLQASSSSVASPDASCISSSFLTELQSIFVDCAAGNDMVKQRPDEFLFFVRQEMPTLMTKFYKLCNGKKD